MRALVTGSAGFVGSHFVDQLRGSGYDVMCVDIASFAPYRRRDALDFFRDARDRYDIVVHCAAVIPDRQTRTDRPLSIAANFQLDAAMFEWAARTRPGRVVYMSSCAAYPIRQPWRPFHETDIDLGDMRTPDALYGLTKLVGEQLAHAARANGVPVTVVRPFSGYGEDQSLNYPFPSFAARARARQDPFEVWGDGTQVRDWIHVDDLVAATLAAVGYGIDGPINLGWGEPVSMGELVMMFCEQAGYTPDVDLRLEAPTGARYRVADPTRMLSFYAPKITLEEGVHRALTANQMETV